MDVKGYLKRHCDILLPLLLSFLLFISLVSLSAVILPGASKIKVTIELDHTDKLQLFYSNEKKKSPFEEKYSQTSEEIEKGEKKEVIFKLSDHSAKRLRIDPGDHAGTVRLYQLKINSHFAKQAILTPDDIYRLFQPDREETIVRLKEDYVEIQFKHDDPQLICSDAIIHTNILLIFVPQLIVAIVFFLVLRQFDLHLFPAISDISIKKPTTGKNIDALDGLRALAMIMVVADHTWGRFKGLGAGGVWIFIGLSGFMLAGPFIHQPGRVFSVQSMHSYVLRRIARIIPAYYFYITIIFLLNLRFDDAIRHFLFLQGNGHLWVIPQIVSFYAIMPIVVGLNYILFRNRPCPTILSLIFLMILANRVFDQRIISLYGMNHLNLRLCMGIFLAGMVFSYIYHQVFVPVADKLQQKFNVRAVFSFLSVALLLFFLLGSTERLWGGKRIFAQIYFQWFGVAAGALIFSILAAKDTYFNRFLSCPPLRALSLVSLSLYLFHPLVMNVIRKGIEYYSGFFISGFPLFISTLCVSYVVACFVYTYVERPFLKRQQS